MHLAFFYQSYNKKEKSTFYFWRSALGDCFRRLRIKGKFKKKKIFEENTKTVASKININF
jgi:hypothetical protein